MNPSLIAHLSIVISDATHCSFKLNKSTPVGGGSINDAYCIEGEDGARYFLKLNDARHYPMFIAETEGLNTIAATDTIRVPHPIAHGTSGGQSYLVLEHQELSSRGDARLFGEQLAALHQCTPDMTNITSVATSSLSHCREKDRMGEKSYADKVSSHSPIRYLQEGEKDCKPFGFMHDNFIGTTQQANARNNNWIDFWREHRLGFQLKLAAENGYVGQLHRLGEKLLDALPAYFNGYLPQPSLLHGDLWSGNHAFLPDGTPTIFDPATYYGDRECDIAMTELFGGFSEDFYAAYRAAYPLDVGYASRRDLYNLYHVLNHVNLFGGAYTRQAEQMMQRLLLR